MSDTPVDDVKRSEYTRVILKELLNEQIPFHVDFIRVYTRFIFYAVLGLSFISIANYVTNLFFNLLRLKYISEDTYNHVLIIIPVLLVVMLFILIVFAAYNINKFLDRREQQRESIKE